MAEEIKNLKRDLDIANSILNKYELHKKLILIGARHYFGEMFKNGEVNTEECADLSNIIKDVDARIKQWRDIVTQAETRLQLLSESKSNG